MESSRASADYYDAERLRQTGLQDGFKAEVKEFTEEDEQPVREMIRQSFRDTFDPGSD